MAKDDHPWPTPGDKAFAPGELSVDLKFRWPPDIERGYTEGFKLAADIIVDQLKDESSNNLRLQLLFPVCFLYRHYLEARLKYILRVGKQLRMTDVSDEIMNGHELYPLWNKTKKMIIDTKAGPVEPLKPIEAVIQEIHNIDKSGQEFRYSRTKGGKPTLKNLPNEVSLLGLKMTVENVDSLLSGYSSMLDEHYGVVMSEMRDNQ